MQKLYSRALFVGLRACQNLRVSQTRNTWVFRHVNPLPKTPPGQHQCPPHEAQIYQIYEVVENENERDPGPLEVVLTQHVEDLGDRGDVINVTRDRARHDLLLTGAAVYASPFNLNKYKDIIDEQRRLVELGVKIGISPWKTARSLEKSPFKISMSLDQPWVIEKWNLRVALRKSNVRVLESSLVLPKEGICGPDLALENSLFRFYVVINRRLVVPCTGRISHVNPSSTKRVVSFGEDDDDQERLDPEDIYVHPTFIPDDLDLWDLMQSNKVSQNVHLETNQPKKNIVQ